MLEILTAIPTETVWKANKYNLRKMRNEIVLRRKVPKKETPVREHRTREEIKIERLETELAAAQEQIQDLQRENWILKSAFDKILKQTDTLKDLRDAVA